MLHELEENPEVFRGVLGEAAGLVLFQAPSIKGNPAKFIKKRVLKDDGNGEG